MNIEEKLMEIQTKLNAPKNRRNSFGNYNYRSCEDILEAVKPLLKEQKCTLVISDDIAQIGERFYIHAVATIRDTESTEGVSVSAYAREADVKKGMDEAQVTGACSSYARKYALNGLFLIDDNKDPDTDENHNERENKKMVEAVVDKQIDKKKTIVLTKMCEENNINVEKLCELYKVETLSDFTEGMFSDFVNKLEKQKGKR